MIGLVGDMLSYPFMQRALLAGVLVAVIAPLVGSFVVYRRMAFIGDTLAHVAFAGVAVGLFVRESLGSTAGSPFLVALVAAGVGALVIQFVSRRTDADTDVAMAIVLSGGFALGTVIISLSGGIAVGVQQYVFGSVNTVSWTHVWIMTGLTALVCLAVAVSYKHLLYGTFDAESARVARLNVDFHDTLLVVLTALVVVAAMQIMGVILVAAMLVVPVAAAAQIAPSFRVSIVLAIVVAEAATLAGITASFTHDLAASGTTVLLAIGLFVALALVGRNRSFWPS